VNYFNTFIAVAPDTSASAGAVPPERGGKKSIAVLEYDLIATWPYELTQEDVQFAVHVRRTGISTRQLDARRAGLLWEEFFFKPTACMRASPLPKSYGWGLHFNAEGKVALVPVESAKYKELSSSKSIEQTRAMRSKRASGAVKWDRSPSSSPAHEPVITDGS
jgi:hypothetical protein